MKSFAFAAALVAVASAVDLEATWGGYGGHGHGYGYAAPKVSVKHTPGSSKQGASAAYGSDWMADSASDFDAYGRDQDLSIEESYGRTNAKSYAAESYDEWDNKDDDKWGAQAWGQDRDVYGASSYGKAASSGDYDQYGKGGYGASNGTGKGYAKAGYGAGGQDGW